MATLPFKAFALPIAVVCIYVGVAPAQDFHTSPACWEGPRTYHAGAPSPDLDRKVERTPNVTREPRENAVISPNGAYKAWVEIPNAPQGNVADQILYVASEQDRVTRFYLEQAQLRVSPSWINEKLVFVRARWGRMVATDLIIDAESGELIYSEEARDGAIAFQQYKEACGQTCPCDPDVMDAVEPPVSKPAKGEVIGHAFVNQLLNQDINPAVAPPPSIPRAPLPVYIDVNGSMQEIIKVSDPTGILTDGHDEWESALVFGHKPGWYQIKLSGAGERLVWIREADAQSFTSMPQRLRQSLAYLGSNWDGRIWASPDGAGGFTHSALYDPGLARIEIAADFIEVRETDGGTWLKVRTYPTEDCGRREADKIDEGWVPAWSEGGKLVGGYYARGC